MEAHKMAKKKTMDLRELFESITWEKLQQFKEEEELEYTRLDFKGVTSSDLSDRRDRENFGKALSGYANAEGGIIIWGVRTKKKKDVDVPTKIGNTSKKGGGINDLKTFVGKLWSFTGEWVEPPITGVDHREVPNPEKTNTGCVVTLIPQSDSRPHRNLQGGDKRYYRRSGDSFRVMGHSELADMFGRPPHPKLKSFIRLEKGVVRSSNEIVTSVEALIIVSLKNEGRGIAKYPCLEIRVSPKSFLRGHTFSCGLEINELFRDQNTGTVRVGTTTDVVIHSGMVQDFFGFPKLVRPNEAPKDVVVDSVMYAENMQPIRGSHCIKAQAMCEKLFGIKSSEE
jgi:hypothetical protein